MDKRSKWTALLISIVLVLSLFPVVAYAASGDTIVYRTKTGECYHTSNCSSLKKSSIQITLQEAINQGLRPCSKCNPPTLDAATKSTPSSTTAAENKAGTSTDKTNHEYGSGTKFTVTVTATCEKYNSVGNEWTKEFSVAGYNIISGDVVAFNKNAELVIVTTITEQDDGYDDVGEAKATHKVTSTEFSNGFLIVQTVTVTENAGKYKGNSAIWTVEYKFSRK